MDWDDANKLEEELMRMPAWDKGRNECLQLALQSALREGHNECVNVALTHGAVIQKVSAVMT